MPFVLTSNCTNFCLDDVFVKTNDGVGSKGTMIDRGEIRQIGSSRMSAKLRGESKHRRRELNIRTSTTLQAERQNVCEEEFVMCKFKGSGEVYCG